MDILRDMLIGFFATAIALYLHAYVTVSEYFGLVGDTKTALQISLVQSVILLIIWIGIGAFYSVKERKIGIPIGSVLALPFMYTLFPIVREGFEIFFQFI